MNILLIYKNKILIINHIYDKKIIDAYIFGT